MDRTRVENGATLTIEPDTELRVESDGYLLVNDGATLTAVGTAEEPILFTSAAAEKVPGDWQCIRFGSGSSASELRYVTLEYGGQPCDADGARKEGTIAVAAAVRAIENVTLTHSSTHALFVEYNANARGIQNITFSDNEKSAVLISAAELLTLGEGLVFEDEDDFIEVDTTFALGRSGNLLAQPVHFRIVGPFSIHDMAEVTFEPGVEFRMAGASFEVFNANLIVAGTEDAPVVFTSSASAPAAGDWGCIHFSSVTGRPSFDHAVIEYAGSGAGCTGANYLTALTVPADAVITNSTFREISGTAIRSQSACPLTKAAWCANVFEEVAEGPVSCQLGNDLGCP